MSKAISSFLNYHTHTHQMEGKSKVVRQNSEQKNKITKACYQSLEQTKLSQLEKKKINRKREGESY